MWIDRRETINVAILVAAFAAVGWLMWLGMSSGEPLHRADATVVSIAPGVQAKGDNEPIRAVIALRTDDGASISLKRPVECMPPIRRGDRVAIQGVTNNMGLISWQLTQDRCPALGLQSRNVPVASPPLA